MVKRQQLGNLQDVVGKSHVEHAVGFIEYEERQLAQVEVSHANMR